VHFLPDSIIHRLQEDIWISQIWIIEGLGKGLGHFHNFEVLAAAVQVLPFLADLAGSSDGNRCLNRSDVCVFKQHRLL